MGQARHRERVQVVYLGEAGGLHSVLVQPPVTPETLQELARVAGRAQTQAQSHLYTEVRFAANSERLAALITDQIRELVLPLRDTVYVIEVPVLLTSFAGDVHDVAQSHSAFMVRGDTADMALISLRQALDSRAELTVDWDNAVTYEYVRNDDGSEETDG